MDLPHVVDPEPTQPIILQFPHWSHIGVHGHLPNWFKEDPPQGVEENLPPEGLQDTGGNNSCFSLGLTHAPNTLHQKVDLVSEGVPVPVLADLRPQICVSGWVYIHHGDDDSSVAMMVKLMDEDDKPVAGSHLLLSGRNQQTAWVEETSIDVLWEKHHGWKKHQLKFCDCPRNVRKVLVMFLGDNVKLTGIKLSVSLATNNNDIHI